MNNYTSTEDLLKLYNSGKNHREIGQIVGLSHQAVSQRLIGNSDYVPRHTRSRKSLPSEETLRFLIDSGKDRDEIKEILSISDYMLNRTLKEYSLRIFRRRKNTNKEIIDAMRDHESLTAAADSLNISLNTLIRRKKELLLPQNNHNLTQSLQAIYHLLKELNSALHTEDDK